MGSPIRQFCCVFLLLVPTCVWAAFGDPRGFFQGETVTETVLHPAVKLYRADGLFQAGEFQPELPMVTHVVAIDLAAPEVSLKPLLGSRFVSEASGQFHRRSLVSQLQADNSALVAINTAFFDISSPGTQTPTGLNMTDGIILREPLNTRSLLATSADKRAIISTPLTMTATVHAGASSRVLIGFNRNSLANGQIVAFQQPWDRSPGTSAGFTSGQDITEVVLERVGFQHSAGAGVPSVLSGRVLAVRNALASVTIGADQIVLTGSGTARPFLQALAIGSTVELRWELATLLPGLDWWEMKDVVAGSARLIMDGGRLSNTTSSHWNDLHPRSAVGISQDGTRMVLVLVEGRQTGRAAGMSLHSVIRYLEHLGAYNALEFDGGGSSALAARVGGINRLVSTPSDGSERYVPMGLGIMVEEQQPSQDFSNIRVTPGADSVMLSWETAMPAQSYAEYGSTGYDLQTVRSGSTATRHQALITGLTSAGTTYLRLAAETEAGKVVSRALDLVLGEVTMDDPEAVFVGSWSTGSFATPWGESYRHTSTVTGTATATATYRPQLGASGTYDVFVWYVQGSNRPTAAQYRIQHSGGIATPTINQTTGGSQWRLLASNLHFAPGNDSYLQVLNSASAAAAAVMADGVRFVLKSPSPLPAGTPPEYWIQHFFGSGSPPAGHVDADGDGRTLWEEFLWTTDPTDRTSQPRYGVTAAAGGGWTFHFAPWHPGREYRVHGRVHLEQGNWEELNLGQPEVANGGATFAIPGATPHRFFRLEVRAP